jgi:hypothetical protein
VDRDTADVFCGQRHFAAVNPDADRDRDRCQRFAPMREDESPEGLIVHSAGQGEQGNYVYDIWESREAFERFMEEKLGPALGEVMGGPPPEGGAPQYFPIDVLIIPH